MAFGKLFVDLALRDKGFSAALKKAGGDVKGLESSAKGLNKVIGGTLKASFIAATATMAAFGAATAKVGSDFQHSITLVKTLSKDGVDNFQALSDEARRLGATTEFSARQSAEAMTNFARAGMNAREIIAATGPALMMAGGAGESMSLATMSMAASLKQFSLDASESGHVADVFTVALKNSLFNLQGLNDAMKYAGPAGAAFGLTIEETTAAVAQFRNMGLDASMAGTAFRMSMVALAKQTPAMTKVMKKYGITTDEVSVSNLGFAGVLNNLADAGVTAEDAIKMFGARAGANMGLLIQQMQKPEIRQGFKDLTTDLYASSQGAGAAKEQYDAMGQTVTRQFLIAKSAIEELMITTFDTYKADLMDFLSAIGEVVQYTADTFKGLKVSGSGLNSMLQDMTMWLKQNKDTVAAFFIDIFTMFQNIAGAINILMPLISGLANVLITIFPTVAMASFVLGIGALPAVFATASAAAASFGVTLNLALGPIGAAMIGLTAFATAVYKFDQVLNSSKDMVVAYNKALDKWTDRQTGWTTRVTQSTRDALKAQQDNFEVQAEWMKSLGASDSQVERYRQRLEALTAETVTTGLASNELFEVTRDGVTEFHNVETAAMILGESGYGKLQEKIDSYKKAQESQTKANELAQARLNKVLGVTDEYTHILEKNGMTQEHLKNVMKANGESISDWRAKIAAGNKSVGTFTDLIAGAVEGLNKYRLAVIEVNEGGGPRTFGQGAGSGDSGPDDAAIKEWKARQEKKAQMLQDLQRMEEDYQVELGKIGLKGVELKKFELEEIKKEINRAHDDQLKEAKSLNIKKQIEDSRANSIKMATDIAARQAEIEHEEEAIETMKVIAEQRAAAIAQVEEAAQTERYDRAEQVAHEHWRMMREIAVAGITLTEQDKENIESGFLQKRLNAAIEDLQARLRIEGREATFAEKLNIAKLKSEITTRNQILSLNKSTATKKEKLEAKAARIEDEIDKTTKLKKKKRLEKQLKRVEKAARKQVFINAKKDLDIRYSEDRKFKFIEKMQKIAQKSGIAALGKGAEKAIGFANKVKDAVADATDPDGPKSPWGKFIKGAGKAVKAVKAIGGAFSAMGKKAVGIFSSLSGFSFDLGGMTDEAMGKKGEMGDAAVEAEAARREEAGEEEMTAEEEAGVREEAEAGFDPKEAAAEVAEQQAEAMKERLMMALEMIPVFVEKLAENLPPLIAAFVESFPDMVTALVEALSGPDGLMVVIAKAVPDLISTIINAIPDLIPPLIEALFSFISEGIPQIIESLTTMIPQLIMSLAEGLPLLIEAIVIMIPQVLQSIIEMLPTLIDSLIALALNLITSLLEQLPILIVELVNQIPVLITALVDAIPLIIQRVVSSLPKIITALINAIPIIILGLIKAIPKLIGALVGAIPTLIKAIFHGLVGIVRAIVVDLVPMLARAVGAAFRKAWKGIKKAMSGMFEKLNPMNWFGDTPGPIRVGSQPQTFGFAANDYIVAAKKPEDLLAQATQLIESNGVPKITKRNRETSVAQMSSTPIGAAAMFGDNPQSRSPAERLAQNIKVQVEGETIDNALITARERGRSPQIWNEIERVAGGGASIGIERHDAE